MALYQTKYVCVIFGYEISATCELGIVISLSTPMFSMDVFELDVIVDGDR